MDAWPFFALSAAGACAGVAAWGAVSATSQLFGPTLHHTPDASLLALTFDDGPNPAHTPQLLSLLERYAAPASFFLVGRFARACPELVREIADRGHSIGNHTETHANLAFLPPGQIAQELRACQESIRSALRPSDQDAQDALPILMRPPFGCRGPQLWSAIRRVGLRGVAMWSLKCYDWKPQPAARLIERLGRVAERSRLPAAAVTEKNPDHGGEGPRPAAAVTGKKSDHGGESPRPATAGKEKKSHHGGESRGPHGGQIVLLHDGDARRLGADRRHVLAALEFWLPRWRDAGFEFVTMNSLLGA
jgi:peptidoglycan/xylan/chitin deacetylase (PgdA/CDA1 family)